jgi:DNA (cytosine-5)-methyltransferase 1
MNERRALNLYAGAGGWEQGMPGVTIDGVEIMAEANATARAAGWRHVGRDVWDHGVPPRGAYDGLIASPPCQTFSVAGKGAGRAALSAILRALNDGEWRRKAWLRTFADGMGDDRSAHVLMTLHYAHVMRPAWVALEQVPTVAPIWDGIAHHLRGMGYTAWAGIVNSEQYGVPQTRKRAVLVASRGHDVRPPVPTHSTYHVKDPARLDSGVLPWVSMADALGLDDEALIGFPRRLDPGRVGVDIGGVAYRERDLRAAGRPAQAVTEKARSWVIMGDVRASNGTVRRVDQPAPTITASADNGNFAWSLLDPGVRTNTAARPNLDGAQVERLTIEQASVLQSFPPAYPWAGSRTARFVQIGNAIPPLLAAAIGRAVLS